MKIVITVFQNIYAINGTTVRVHRVLELIKKKHEVAVITCSDKGQTRLKGIEDVRIIDIKGIRIGLLKHRFVPVKFPPIIIWNLIQALSLLKNKFDIVYCAHSWFGFPSIYLVSKLRRYKIIFEAHSILSEEAKEVGHSGVGLRLRQFWERFVIRHSDCIIALSQNTFGFYRPYNNMIELVPVFIEDDLFRTSKEKAKEGGSKLVGLIGPFDTTRNLDSLRLLYSRINEFNNRLHFVVIGRCEHRKQNHRIEYTGYLQSTQDYIDQLSRLDAVLVTEKIATSGPLNKIIEPMACGIPVFTTPKGLVGLHWVEPGKDIFVFEEDRLVDEINKTVFDNEVMRMVGENAREVVERYYSRKANEDKLLRILGELVSKV